MQTISNGQQPTFDYATLLTLPDSDNIRIKNIVRQRLLDDSDILYLLGASEENLKPEGYMGKYILPWPLADGDIAEIHNRLCYETSFYKLASDSGMIKKMRLSFQVYIDRRDAVHAQSGIAKHDLISALLTRKFNWSEAFGSKCRLIRDTAHSDRPGYVMRTLVFECELPNGITKTNPVTGESSLCDSDPDERWF